MFIKTGIIIKYSKMLTYNSKSYYISKNISIFAIGI